MRATYLFKHPVPWARNENGQLDLANFAGDTVPGVKHVLWCDDEKGYEFKRTDGTYVFVPERNIVGILYEKDLPDPSEVPDK